MEAFTAWAYFCFRNSVSARAGLTLEHKFSTFPPIFPHPRGSGGSGGCSTSKGSLFPPKAPVEGNIQVSKGHHELQKSSWHNACPPLSKSECNLQYPVIHLTNPHILEWAFQQQLGIQILGEILASEVWLPVPWATSLFACGVWSKEGKTRNKLKIKPVHRKALQSMNLEGPG